MSDMMGGECFDVSFRCFVYIAPLSMLAAQRLLRQCSGDIQLFPVCMYAVKKPHHLLYPMPPDAKWR
jgi:hypothetical protein